MLRACLLAFALTLVPAARAEPPKAIEEAIKVLEKGIAESDDDVEKSRLKSAITALKRIGATDSAADKEQLDIPAEKRKQMNEVKGKIPNLKGFNKGEIGYLDHDLAVVGKVVNDRQAVITLSIINPGAGGKNAKMNVLVSGIDTSGLADGKPYRMRGTFYIAGNTTVGDQTMMKAILFKSLPGERDKK